MTFQVIPIDSANPDAQVIGDAAILIKQGSLVAFPTETVYGLGANGTSADAVQKIYEAKGRPSNNPLILHVSSIEDAKALVTAWPDVAEKLAESFWPGPLTFVLPKKDSVIPEVTGGGPTVAIRIPAHPVALALIKASGVPIAAPSANRSGNISPVSAEHVHNDFGDSVMILDGGKTLGGIESTVIDLTCTPPRLLRPGLVTVKDIEHIIGSIEVSTSSQKNSPLPSPGMLSRHYAPRTKMIFGSMSTVEDAMKEGKSVGFLGFAESKAKKSILMPKDHAAYASKLYDTLHELDREKLDLIIAEPVPETDEWLAVRDRLHRGSATA